MQSIKQACHAEISVKGSKFLASAYPVQDLKQIEALLSETKKAHPKARHWCYAYRLGADGSEYRANDDGEPSGTAGMPIYQQLLSFEASDILLIVVRYFGGTLLGVPGLIKAYKDSSRAALEEALWQPLIAQEHWLVCCDYAQLNYFYYYNQQHHAEIIEQDLGLACRFQVRLPAAEALPWSQQLAAQGLQCKPCPENP